MSTPRYLARLADRATRSLDAVCPPRWAGRLLAELPEPIPSIPILRTPPPVAAIPSPPESLASPDAPAKTVSAPAPRAIESTSQRSAAPVPAEAIAAVVAPPRERPRADFVFAAPRRTAPREEMREPRAPAKPNASPQHDPLAALAAAVRWTSSDSTTPERDIFDAPEPVSTQPSPAASPQTPVPVVAVTTHAAPARISPTPTRRVNQDRTSEQPRETTREPTRATPTAVATAPDRFTSIHIGSVEVEIVAPPPASAEPAAAAPAPLAPLARGLSTSIGLRQS